MRQLIALVAFVGLLIFSCAPSPEKPKNPEVPTTANSKKPKASVNPEGQKLYKKYCMLCHGADGKRGTNGAYDLTVSKLTFNQKVEIVKNGRGVMTPFDFLGDEKIKLVVEYLETLEQQLSRTNHFFVNF